MIPAMVDNLMSPMSPPKSQLAFPKIPPAVEQWATGVGAHCFVLPPKPWVFAPAALLCLPQAPRVSTHLLLLRRFTTVSDDEKYLDDLEFYEEKFSRTPPGRKGVKRKHDARPERALEDAGLAGPAGAAASWTMTYVPARFEAVWLRASLASFYEEEWISDVLASIKGGKEANVYRCQAHPNTGEQLLAAKVYRPRQFRNLRNDKAYRDGRAILTPEGRSVKHL